MADDLIKQAQNGDAQAFSKLYESYVDRIYKYFFYKTKTIEEAQDLTSLVFEKALKNLRQFKKKVSFQAWLFTIARNSIYDYWRTKKKNLNLDQISQLPSKEDVLEKVIVKEEQTKVLSALSKLNDEQKEVLILRFINNLNVREVAKIINKTEVNVRIIQHRALKSMRKLI